MKSIPKVMISEESYSSLVEVRERLGLKQRELADLLGVAPNYISMIEAGRKPFSPKLIKKLELLESNFSSNQRTDTLLKEQVHHYSSGPCQECAKKDAEINRLNKIIDKLVSR